MGARIQTLYSILYGGLLCGEPIFVHLRSAMILWYGLVLVALYLPSRMWAFSSRSEQGTPSSCGAQVSHCSGFSCCGRSMGFST